MKIILDIEHGQLTDDEIKASVLHLMEIRGGLGDILDDGVHYWRVAIDAGGKPEVWEYDPAWDDYHAEERAFESEEE